ncbi:MAG TPA: prepilin-type N-terminal cleavage/methylation domain-containing protein [Methylomirabilota bacterium]|nr:prepilin-type N-terminal cleavage/methylation domain-containing protein [Methylomirabilota bacterium]
MTVLPGRAGSQTGFTLLEVLVALAILGLAVVTLMQLAAQSLRLIGLSDAHQQAVLLADRVARESPAPREGVESGEDGEFSWERRTAAVGLPEELRPSGGKTAGLYSVAVTVRWGGGRAVELATLRTSSLEVGVR